MNPRRALAIALVAGLLRAAGARGQPGAEPALAAPPAPPDALELARQGRRQLKANNFAAAAAKLKEAVDLGEREQLDAEELAVLHYVYALALLRSDKDEPARAELRRSLALNPKDSEVRVVLATQLLAADEPEQARAEAELALKQGLPDKDDVKTAHKLIEDARSQLLHDKLSVTATASFSYDSNVLQGGQIIQIANKSLRSQRATRALGNIIRSSVTRPGLLSGDVNFVTGVYLTPSPPTTEWDLPLNVDVDVQGRLFSRSKVELWLGYRFQQTFLSSIAFDHDDYNFQQHEAPLRLELRPVKWLAAARQGGGVCKLHRPAGVLPVPGRAQRRRRGVVHRVAALADAPPLPAPAAALLRRGQRRLPQRRSR